MANTRKATDSPGEIEVPADKLWGAQTQRSPTYFSIGSDLMPGAMIAAYAILKKAAAIANHDGGRLDDRRCQSIVRVCDEILAGRHQDMFPLHVWLTGSGTQFNMPVQHERERGDLQSLLSARGHGAWLQDAGPPERPRQHVVILERQLSVRDVCRRGDSS